jgi:hypothetical protein
MGGLQALHPLTTFASWWLFGRLVDCGLGVFDEPFWDFADWWPILPVGRFLCQLVDCGL